MHIMSVPSKVRNTPYGIALLEMFKPLKGIKKVEAYLEWATKYYKDPEQHVSSVSGFLFLWCSLVDMLWDCVMEE